MKKLSLVAWMKLAAAAVGVRPSRYSMLAYNGGKLRVNGIPLPVVVDLSGLQVSAGAPILIDHKNSTDHTFGQIEEIGNDGRTLSLAGPITGNSPVVDRVLSMAAGRPDEGIPPHQWQTSITCHLLDWAEIQAGQQVQINGQVHTGPFIWSKVSKLTETSILAAGADSDTVLTLAASAVLDSEGMAMNFEDWCKAMGIDPATLTPAAKDVLMKSFNAEQGQSAETQAAAASAATAAAATAGTVATPVAAAAAGAPAIDLTAQRKAYADEARRVAGIEAATVGFLEVRAAAIEGGWSVEKAENAVMKKKLAGGAPAGHVRSTDNSPLVLEAALCQRANVANHEKAFDEKTLEAARRQFRGGIGIQQLLLMAAAENGMVVTPGMSITRGNFSNVMKYASARHNELILQAAPSTLDIPGILSNAANKEIVAGYEQGDTAWREIAEIKSCSDFKEVTTYRMLDNMKYERLPKGGVIKHGTVGEESYTRQVHTYAKMFSLDRVDIVNDDLSALNDLRKRMGLGASIALNEIFWTNFMASLATLFTSARGNYISGATTSLLTDGVGLGLALKAFRTMKSPTADGQKRVNADSARGTGVGGKPAILLVGPSNEAIADKLYMGDTLNVGSGPGERNIYQNKYRPVVAWQLEDAAYTGNSTTQWLLLNDPKYLAAMVVSFLDGVETPTVESEDATFNTLGIDLRGYHDFGCDDAEYLAGVHSKGAA